MSRHLDRARLRLRSLLRGNDVDAALKSELRVHLEEQIDENVAAGMSRDEARAAALRLFGPVGLIEDACRDTRRVALIEHLLQDLRYTLRSLAQQPMLAAAAVVSIAVGIGANTAIFSLLSQLFLATPTVRRPEQIVRIRMGGNSHVSYRQWRDLEDSCALAGLAGYNIEASVNWRGRDQSVSIMPLIVTPNFFDVLGVSRRVRPGIPVGGDEPGTRSGGRGDQPSVLAESARRGSIGARVDARAQRPAAHGRGRAAGGSPRDTGLRHRAGGRLGCD